MRTKRDARGRRRHGVRLPAKTRRGTPRTCVLNDRDIYAFKELLEIPLIRTRPLWRALPAEVRGGFTNFRDRVGDVLFNVGGYLSYPDGQRMAHGEHLNKPAIWRLTERGKKAVEAAGEYEDDVARFYTKDNPATNRAVPHAMLTWDPLIEVKIGINDDPLARWRSWIEMIQNAPQATKEKEIPYQFRVTIQGTFKNGKVSEPYTFNLTPDGQPFGAEYLLSDKRVYRNFVLEAETGENRVEPSNFKDISFFRKFLGWNAVGARKRRGDGTFEPSLHETQLGIKSLFVLVPCPSALHIRNMQRSIMRVTNGRGSTRFLFHRVPLFATKDDPMPPLWTSPWERAGHPPFRLSNPTSHGVCEECNEDRPEEEFKRIEVKGGRRPVEKWLCLTCQGKYKKAA